MERLILKDSVIKAIQQDADIFAQLAKHLEIAPVSLPQILYANHKRLTEATNLKFIAKITGLNENNLLTTEKKAVA